ncbi:DUF1648 domain-containing protein [Alkalibacillus silvisoli]|uniref:DUF1648 domain-containing protein n=1 Tax=Alkalibacillus silvisoli TaxID=392823 RepID=A0ABP3JWY3_9BACI
MGTTISWTLLAIIFIPVFLVLASIPYLTRRTESFGVSIPEEMYQNPELEEMRKRYLRWMFGTALFILALSIIVWQYTPLITGGVIPLAVVSLVILAFCVYLKFHLEMKQLKKDKDWERDKVERTIVDIRFQQRGLTHSMHWFWVSAAIWAGTVLLTVMTYDQIPDTIPLQYNFEGEVTRTAEKSWLSVSFIPMMQLIMIGVFIGVSYVIRIAKQSVDPSNPEKSLKQSSRFRRRWSAFTIVNGTVMVLLFVVIQLSFIYTLPDWVITTATLGLSAVIVIGAIVLAFSTGQGGTRIRITDKNGREDKIERDLDRHWKLGIFYVNRHDPALFMEKRFGVGWTINFARPLAWLLIVGLLMVTGGLPILLTYLM